MKFARWIFIAALSMCATTAISPATIAAEPIGKITILYDAFGADPAMTKDWGFSALVEVAGKRILFDTGDNAEIFEKNVKAKGVDLTTLDFVVLSHRHADHMAGLSYVLSVNPKITIYAPKEGFGIYGSSLPSTFYRKDDSLPEEMRYYSGKPPKIMEFGTAWPTANFQLIDQTTEIMPGITLIALISDLPGTKELKELSLAVNTPDGVVLVVGLFASRNRTHRRGRNSHQSEDSSRCRRLPPCGCHRRRHREDRDRPQGQVPGREHCPRSLHG
ncbi:metal-dependent hydrolase (beta-lactamase superfamily II) [Bradyrhizobium diazoefficiens]